MNDQNQLLLVQEKWLRGIKVPHWKLPGGVCDPGELGVREVKQELDCWLWFLGEDLWKTAMRETLEETGIRTEFVSLLCFRQMHGYNWGIDDLYFACLLRPLNTDIQVNPSEIAAAKWMDVSAIVILFTCVRTTTLIRF